MMIVTLALGFLRSKWGGVIAAGGLFAVSLGLTVALGISTIKGAAHAHHEASLQRSIDDPKTGFRVQVSSCKADFAQEQRAFTTVYATLKAQTASLAALKAENDRRKAQATRDAQALRLAHDTRVRAGAREEAAILAMKPVGDLCVATNKLLGGE